MLRSIACSNYLIKPNALLTSLFLHQTACLLSTSDVQKLVVRYLAALRTTACLTVSLLMVVSWLVPSLSPVLPTSLHVACSVSAQTDLKRAPAPSLLQVGHRRSRHDGQVVL